MLVSCYFLHIISLSFCSTSLNSDVNSSRPILGRITSIYSMAQAMKIHTMSTYTEAGNPTIRKVQAYTGERSLTIVLPRSISEELQIDKIDFLKVHLDKNRLILEKDDT